MDEELILQGTQNGLGLRVDSQNEWSQVSLLVKDGPISLGADDRNIVCDRIGGLLAKALDGSIRSLKSVARDGHELYWCLSLFELHASGYLYCTPSGFNVRFYPADNSAAFPDIELTAEIARDWQSRLMEFKRPRKS